MRDHENNNHSLRKRKAAQMQSREQLPNEAQPQNQAQSSDDDVVNNIDFESDHSGDDEGTIIYRDPVNPKNLGFGDEQSRLFFEQCCMAADRKSGALYLVKRSQRKEQYTPQDYANLHIEIGQAMTQIRIAHLAFMLTRGQVQRLAEVLRGTHEIASQDGFECCLKRARACCSRYASAEVGKILDGANVVGLIQKFLDRVQFKEDFQGQPAFTHTTTVPFTWNGMRQSYLEGARSILSNLPIPVIRQDVPNHSYVSITDCIRHFLGHEDLSEVAIIPNALREGAVKQSVDHSSTSVRAQEIIHQQRPANAMASYVLMWSDDVEPNRTKANRGSVWLMTATIATRLENGHSMAHTFPIAVGKKGENHNPVIAKVEELLQELRTGSCGDFYLGTQNKKASMTFELFATLQDQPERRDFNCLRAGNGAHTARFGVSANHLQIYTNGCLRACGDCRAFMKQCNRMGDYTWPLQDHPDWKNCNECVRWDVLDDPKGLALCTPPAGYPADSYRIAMTRHGPLLAPFEITYESLIRAVDTAHERFVDANWTSQNCEAFLEVEGLSNRYIERVMEHCIHCYSLKQARLDPERNRVIIDAAAQEPAKYSKVPYPCAWTRPTMSLRHHPEVIMHLLFLGIVKSTVIQIQNCLSAQSKLASFIKSTDGYLNELCAMSLEWIAIQPYQGGRMGGWVSENFLGFCRILPWFYQNVTDAAQSTADDAPPDNLPQSRWLHRHNKHWLKIRGFDTTGNRAELRQRVAGLIAEGAHEPLPQPDIPPSTIRDTLLSLIDVVRCIMNPRVTPELVNRTRTLIRIFLSDYDSMSERLEKKNPSVISSYNFLCLLNVPDAMEKFGPLRCIWEGGPRGEGFARFAKPYMTQGLRQNWHHSLLTRLHQGKAFDSVNRSLAPPAKPRDDIKGDDALSHRKGMLHKYDSVFSVQQRLRPDCSLKERKPVSVLMLELANGAVDFYTVIGNYHRVLRLEVDESRSYTRFGLDYRPFKIPSNSAIPWRSVAPTVTKMGFGMLLPVLECGGDCGGDWFTLVSSNWGKYGEELFD